MLTITPYTPYGTSLDALTEQSEGYGKYHTIERGIDAIYADDWCVDGFMEVCALFFEPLAKYLKVNGYEYEGEQEGRYGKYHAFKNGRYMAFVELSKFKTLQYRMIVKIEQLTIYPHEFVTVG